MIDLRLMGPADEVRHVAAVLEEVGIDIRSRSSEHPMRDRKGCIRIYLQVDPGMIA